MRPVAFVGQNVILAKDQPQYQPLPVHWNQDEGIVTSCWKLTFWERIKVLFSGVFWFQQYTFNAPLQPQKPSVEKPTW